MNGVDDRDPMTEDDWRARERLVGAPRCSICRRRLALGQPGVHYSCAEAKASTT